MGYVASALVLATFSVRGQVSLRLLAMASNVAFIAYAAMTGIGPVLALHVVLLPVNALRLTQALRPHVRVAAAVTFQPVMRSASGHVSADRPMPDPPPYTRPIRPRS